MSEYWKSTPSYWCKFCSQYVKDTALEKRNHESSAKHQNNIQRSLRQLHKGKEREEREKQFAKDEVARLNGIVGGSQSGERRSATNGAGTIQPNAAPLSNLTPAQARRKQAEELVRLGVALPEELKREVQGVGSYQAVGEEVERRGGAVTISRSMADILREAQQGEVVKKEEDEEDEEEAKVKLEDIDRKRKFEDDEELSGDEAVVKRNNWGNATKSYPGRAAPADPDLDGLLNGVKKVVKTEQKEEDGLPAVNTENPSSSAAVPPIVTFKKRKGKK